jgi:hypothetical protein
MTVLVTEGDEDVMVPVLSGSSPVIVAKNYASDDQDVARAVRATTLQA